MLLSEHLLGQELGEDVGQVVKENSYLGQEVHNLRARMA